MKARVGLKIEPRVLVEVWDELLKIDRDQARCLKITRVLVEVWDEARVGLKIEPRVLVEVWDEGSCRS